MALPWNERCQTFLILGVLMTAGSAFVLWDLGAWEADPERPERSMPWPVAFLYDIGGRWAVAALVLGVGLILLKIGIGRRRFQRTASGPVADTAER